MKNNKTFGLILTFSRLLVGTVFVFSGFVKGIDPLGTVYKINDYLDILNIQVHDDLSLFLSIGLNAIEFIMGFALLINIYGNLFSRTALLFMAVSTPVTLYLAIYNPVTDCGCFGDALILSNWETFSKNLALSVLVIFLFVNRKNLHSPHSQRRQAVLISAASVSFLALSELCYARLPLIDFRPYKVGTYIPDGMIVPEGAPLDSFQTICIYRKGDIEKSFTLENIPWQDTSWQFVDSRTKLIREGYRPPIHDFVFTKLDGTDITDQILYDSSFLFLAVAHDLEKADKKGLHALKDIYRFCRKNEFSFYVATSSSEATLSAVRDSMDLPFEFYAADGIMLKTIIRANPGLVLIKNGTILGKWHYADLPELKKEKFVALIGEDNRQTSEYSASALFFGTLAALSLIVIYFPLPKKNDLAYKSAWLPSSQKKK